MFWHNSLFSLAMLAFVLMFPHLALSQCLKCHQSVLDAVQQQLVIHSPVSNKQCAACHAGEIADNMLSATLDQTQTTDVLIADFDTQKKIHWLAETFTPATEYFALLPQNCADGPLTLEVWLPQRGKLQFDIDVPSFTALKILPQQPQPCLNQIHLNDYNNRLLSQATLSWVTSTPCRCRITYGLSGAEYNIDEDDLYALQHRMVLRNFHKNYLFHIDCLDPFGQRITNKTKRFTLVPQQAHPTTVNDVPLLRQQIITHIQRLEHQIWLELRSPQEISVSIGTTEQLEKKKTDGEELEKKKMDGEELEKKKMDGDGSETAVDLSAILPEVPEIKDSGGSGKEIAEHSGLLTGQAINTAICYRCHPNMLTGMSHPVDVVAPPGMIVSSNYPLLPDGRMSCMTCHTVHSGNNNYRLRKNSKRELCIGCHTNY